MSKIKEQAVKLYHSVVTIMATYTVLTLSAGSESECNILLLFLISNNYKQNLQCSHFIKGDHLKNEYVFG
jgi:hypothetical protein